MESSGRQQARPARSAWARAAWSTLGMSCIAVGAVGVVVPGLPTTPFLILAAACFFRSSDRLYGWLIHHRRFGPLIRDFRAGHGVPRRVKAVAITLVWIFAALSLGPGLPAGNLVLRIVVAGAALAGTIYLLRLPSRCRA
ncbi:MAG TPA: YbaN family protein [Acidobacteriota bacterium]